ncbi:hypothetical protein BDQ94DRAFT_147218 [Aspergillus welwitschiae]|uniref:Uncharacterized protein n=1 Tax=Aspergillus welwitschiae TaxID=1341132 RepID=A0A3F3PWV2_9EURO|nr:hypothetical protein BDQ94DRAFT_147218 [Aspergillus welwitschiae]RDH31341.1 hypothetical protein BDQ94DRAFT_147218 [Aspergillus welwitschiae]
MRRWRSLSTDWQSSSFLVADAGADCRCRSSRTLMGWDDKRGIDSSGHILLPAPLWPDSSSPRSSAYQRKRQTNRVLTMQT